MWSELWKRKRAFISVHSVYSKKKLCDFIEWLDTWVCALKVFLIVRQKQWIRTCKTNVYFIWLGCFTLTQESHVLYSPCLYCSKVMYLWLDGSSIPYTASRLELLSRHGPFIPPCWEIFSCSSCSTRNSLGFSEWKQKKKKNNEKINLSAHVVF